MDEQKPDNEKVVILTILLDKKTGQISLNGILGQKQMVLNALGEAIKVVANFDPPKVQPVHGIINGARNLFKR